ncbi:MAG: hypothetical protein HW412_1979 [Bacteroidetes bacterium]|nr:hypothetical protein [Bacteroidota bacterium]
MMRHVTTTLALTLAASLQSSVAQPTTPRPAEITLELERPLLMETPQTGLALTATLAPGEDGEDKKDPAYKTYKQGYDAILDEDWNDAIKKFAEVTSKYPKSDYVDDAEYWTAYALSHTNRKKAAAAYERFMEKYPESRYVDDAVADLGNLEPAVIAPGDGNHVAVWSSGEGYSYAVPAQPPAAETEMRKAESILRRQMSLHSFRLDRLRIPPMASFRAFEVEKLDPETKIRMEALYAIGDSQNDEKAFQTLKEVALDRKQPAVLRNAALEALTDFKKFDILSVYIDLAKTDTNERIQSAALEYIAEASKDKNKSIDVLVDLYKTTPKQRSRQLQTMLYIIADIGNDKAVDFLATVARTDNHYELRSDAVYYLGTIGGEKSRTVLYQILRNK